jgi:hypothetical protein
MGLCFGSSLVPRAWPVIWQIEFNPPTPGSNVQPEKARDKENDDDDADDIEDVHGGTPIEACAISNESSALQPENVPVCN